MSGRRRILVAIALFSASACGEGARAPAALVPVTVATARQAAGSPDPGFIGVVVAGESVEVEPKVEGRIEEIFVKPGDEVEAGAGLVRLDVQASQHSLAIAKAALDEASRRLSRRVRLARTRPGAITAEEIDGARREVLQERARVAQLTEARGEATVRAPFAGTIVERYLAVGALAGPQRPVVRLVGRGEPRVRFAIPEDRAGAVAVGTRVEVRLEDGARVLSARVSGVSPEIDAASRMVFAAAMLETTATPMPPGDGQSAVAPPTTALATGTIARVFLPAPRTAAAPAVGAP